MVSLIMILLLLIPLSSYSWDGFDYDTGDNIEIDDSDISSVKPGAVIQIYDHQDQNHHIVEIMSVVNTLNETNVEVFDQDTDEYRTLEMEGIKIGKS